MHFAVPDTLVKAYYRFHCIRIVVQNQKLRKALCNSFPSLSNLELLFPWLTTTTNRWRWPAHFRHSGPGWAVTKPHLLLRQQQALHKKFWHRRTFRPPTRLTPCAAYNNTTDGGRYSDSGSSGDTQRSNVRFDERQLGSVIVAMAAEKAGGGRQWSASDRLMATAAAVAAAAFSAPSVHVCPRNTFQTRYGCGIFGRAQISVSEKPAVSITWSEKVYSRRNPSSKLQLQLVANATTGDG